jgi:hypothetical protein
MSKEIAKTMYELWKSANGVGSTLPENEEKNRDDFYAYLIEKLGQWRALQIDQLLGED